MGSFKDFVNNGKAPTIKEEPPMIQRPNVQSNRAVPQSIRRIPPKRPPRMPKRETDVLTEAENTIAYTPPSSGGSARRTPPTAHAANPRQVD